MSSVVSSAFNVAVAGPLAAYLTDATSAPTSLFGALNGTATTPTSVFGVLKASATNGGATSAALVAGALTTVQQRVIATVGATGPAPASVPWNANGTEPSTVANIRTNGWIKLVGKTTDPTTGKPNGGLYVLTPVGKAIYQRTGGGQVNAAATVATPAAGSGTADAAQASANAQAELQQSIGVATGVLSSLGINLLA